MSQYDVYLRSESGERIGQLESFTNLTFIRRFNEAGTWSLVSTPEQLAGLTKRGGIEVFRDGKPHFSGIVRKFIDEDGLTMTVNGKNDLVYLENELAYPVPSGAPYILDYDVRSGVAETVIKQYVDLNIGPTAVPARQIAGLTIETDYGRGLTVTGRARFDKLMDLIDSLAVQGRIGFRIQNLIFEVYVPEDKTGTIIFSKNLGTLGKYTFSVEAGKANYLVCGGSGEGSARTFVEGCDSDSIVQWGRAESFLDKGNTSAVEELNGAITEELAKQGEKLTLNFTPVITENMKPVDDYDVGDWVTAVINNVTTYQQIREMKTVLDVSGGETITMAIGTDGSTSDATTLSRIYSKMRGIDQRLNTYERR